VDPVTSSPPQSLSTLLARFDGSVFDAPRGRARLRLGVTGEGEWDVVVEGDRARLEPAAQGREPDALLLADPATWRRIAADLRGGMDAFRTGRLRVRRDLHLGVGLLAATSGMTGRGRLTFRRQRTDVGDIALLEAGVGDPVVMLHGLGGTKASFLPSVAAMADGHRAIAIDLPGFGDSVKPLGAAYDARFFARAVVSLLDALELERADLIGNSLGGRVALETGLRAPDRVGRLALLCTALAWRTKRPWAPLLRWVRPELGLIQPVSRRATEAVVQRLIPGAADGWVAAGVDEFLRAYYSPRGRAAFYAALRNIYLDEPDGPEGFWTRLRSLEPDTLFVWGREDTLVPVAFARHVERVLPRAQHLELDCGHVPQLEAPREVHAAIRDFFAGARGPRERAA
jgi:pimeloyl-ACP methyl ester carboxylesterase